MNNKTLLILAIVGVAGVAGYYFWKKSKHVDAVAKVADNNNQNGRSNNIVEAARNIGDIAQSGAKTIDALKTAYGDF